MPPIALIAAVAQNRVIGRNNAMPWHISADLKYFKSLTMGKPVIMGRRTYDSIGKPLPGRRNIVISRTPESIAANGVQTASSLDAALTLAQETPADEIFVIGGGEIYRQALPRADYLYLTEVGVTVSDGDVFFPEFDREQWAETHRTSHQQETPPFDFVGYRRRAAG